MRSRCSAGSAFVSLALAALSIYAFRINDAGLGWVGVILALEFLLIAGSILFRYVTVTEDRLIVGEIAFGIYPLVTEVQFNDIKEFEVVRGPMQLRLEGVLIPKLWLENGKSRLLASVSASANSNRGDLSARFDTVVSKLEERINNSS